MESAAKSLPPSPLEAPGCAGPSSLSNAMACIPGPELGEDQRTGSAKSQPVALTDAPPAQNRAEHRTDAEPLPGLQSLVSTQQLRPVSVLAESPSHSHGDAIDHSNLFEGLDADAFDDVSLSPTATDRTYSTSPDATRSIHSLVYSRNPLKSAIEGCQADQLEQAIAQDGTGKTDPLGSPTDLLGSNSGLFDLPQTQTMQDSQEDTWMVAKDPSSSRAFTLSGPAFTGFQSAKGKALVPSEAALASARRLFAELADDFNDPDLTEATTSASDTSFRPSSYFKTGKSVSDLPEDRDKNHAQPKKRDQSITPRMPLRQIQSKRPDPREQGADRDWSPSAKVGDTEVERHQPRDIGFITPSAKKRRNEDAEAVSTPIHLGAVSMLRGADGHRSVVMRSTIASPAPSTSALRTPNRNCSPQTKRISLGVTPRPLRQSSAAPSPRPRFRTPFKNGIRPVMATASPADTSQVYGSPFSRAQALRPQQGSLKTSVNMAESSAAVFSISHRGKRLGLAEYGISPEGISPLQAIAKGVPDEVLVILDDASKASLYAFDGPAGVLLGPSQALETLQHRGCLQVDLAWVQNHWSLILWKMASLSRHCPNESSWRWTWDELISQLLYRYEREVHLAHRSCIKRIQEHDSSPQSPMTLFVTRILTYQEEECDEFGQKLPMEVMLELSDGWYRIRASLDNTLASAVRRGRLRVGQKLAIAGAKLQSSGDGTEVLAALLTSTLLLNGNSVSLARWDARLGFSRDRYFASLRSLTPDGGIVAAMDIIITKVFPLAFLDTNQDTRGAQNARGESEEAEVQESWRKRREETMARLESQFNNRGRKLESLLIALEEAGEGSNVGLGTAADFVSNIEDEALSVFHTIEHAENVGETLQAHVFGPQRWRLLPVLSRLVRARLMADADDERAQVERELERLCPSRNVRDFKVVKFRDARLPPAPKETVRGKNPYARSVQLTVWEASKLGDLLREGARFIVTNLVPTSKSAWRQPDEEADVFLSTRRDTRWTLVDNRAAL